MQKKAGKGNITAQFQEVHTISKIRVKGQK